MSFILKLVLVHRRMIIGFCWQSYKIALYAIQISKGNYKILQLCFVSIQLQYRPWKMPGPK